MPHGSYIDSVLAVTSPTRVCFSWSGRDYPATIVLDGEILTRLRELETDPLSYGSLLFDTVFCAGSRPHIGFQTALTLARAKQQRLRFRLKIATDHPVLHGLFWELLHDTSQQLPIGCSPDTVLSRYAEIPLEPGAPVMGRPRLLCMIAAPRDHQRYGLSAIDYETVKRDLETALEPTRHILDFELLDPPATLLRLRAQLHENEYHLLHILGHGVVHAGDRSCLVLEKSDGSADFLPEEQLQKTFLGDRDLRLVTLVACQGGTASSTDVFSGLAGRLVDHGLPAVIAFRHEVKHSTAKVFTEHFYRELTRTGGVDIAISEARQRLYLDQPDGFGWTSPVLYMRLSDGLLWSPCKTMVPIPPPVESASSRARAPLVTMGFGLVLTLVMLATLEIYRRGTTDDKQKIPEKAVLPPPTLSIEKPSEPPPRIDLGQLQKAPFIDAAFLYSKLPDASETDTTTWRSKIEGVLSHELGAVGLGLTHTNNARWLAIVELGPPAISPGEIAEKAAKICRITASFQIYRERQLVRGRSTFYEKAIKFDSTSACETAVQRVATRVGSAMVEACSS